MYRLSVSLFVLVSALIGGEARAASFIPLGTAPSGERAREGFGVSDDGRVAVGETDWGRAFKWIDGDGLLPYGGGPATAYDVSPDGAVVVGRDSWNESAFYHSASGWIPLVPDSEGLQAIAYGVSADGKYVVGTKGDRAFQWKYPGGHFSDLIWADERIHPSEGSFTEAKDVSADGTIVAGTGDGPGTFFPQACIWQALERYPHRLVWLGLLSPTDMGTTASAISADGRTVVGEVWEPNYATGGISTQAFRWQAEGDDFPFIAGEMHGLGFLYEKPNGDHYSGAHGVSGDGSVVVGGTSILDAGHIVQAAFIWDEAHEMRNLKQVLVSDYGLDLTGWKLSRAEAISANGWAIAGSGLNPDGKAEAWVARLDPTELHWVSRLDGQWEDPDNWDFAEPPTEVTNVHISDRDCSYGITVYGASVTWVKSLTLGDDCGPTSTLELESGSSLSTVGGARIGSDFALVHAGGTVSCPGGTENVGILRFDGSTGIWGNVNNVVTENPFVHGLIEVLGSGNVTVFHDDLHNDGEVWVDEGCTAIIEGWLSGQDFLGPGSPGYPGPGNVEYTYFDPGESPGMVSFGGNLIARPGAHLTIEIGGTERGIDYDAVNVAGLLSLDGTLEIVLINDYVPGLEDSFHIFGYRDVEGDFTEYRGLDLPNGLTLDFSFTPNGGTASVVPEPSTFVLAAFGLLGLGLYRWRRKR